MSWQQMDSREAQYERKSSIERGYERTSTYHSYSAHLPGQKLSPITGLSSPSFGKRLALAIVSLILWVIVFLIVAAVLLTSPANMTVISPNSPPVIVDLSGRLHIIDFLFVFALLLFTIFALLINILFNRKH